MPNSTVFYYSREIEVAGMGLRCLFTDSQFVGGTAGNGGGDCQVLTGNPVLVFLMARVFVPAGNLRQLFVVLRPVFRGPTQSVPAPQEIPTRCPSGAISTR